MNMKKTFVKLGVLAVALALVFASCAQPTDEEGSSTGHDTILRLWIEDTVAGLPLLAEGDNIVITLASATGDRWNYGTRASILYQTVYQATYDATIAVPGTTEAVAVAAATAAAEDAIGDGANGLHTLMRSGADGAEYLLRWRSLTNVDTFLNPQTPQGGTGEGRLYNVIGTGEVSNIGAIVTGYTITDPMLTQTKEGKYIDVFLYDTTAGRNQVWQKTGSYYVFLTKEDATGVGLTPGALPPGTYVYTKDATARNQTEQENPISGLHQDRRYNGNVKKFSFKNGVNELHLQNFSR
jgi:hypothetical protein